MRRYLTKQCVTFGAVLLLGPVCSHAHAQPQRHVAAGLGQYAAVPPIIGHGAFGLTALPQPAARPAYGQPQPAARPAMPAAVQPSRRPAPGRYESAFPPHGNQTVRSEPRGESAADRPSERKRAAFPKLLSNRSQDASAPAPTLASQRQPNGTPIATLQPAGGPLARGVRAQTPATLPQGPVVVYMPAGWQPPGAEVSFTERKTDPEVPADFWPAPTRNPLGDASDGGLFRWPKFTRPNSDDDDPSQTVPRGSGKALIASAHSTPPSKRAAALAAQPKRPWDVLLGTSSGDQRAQPGVKSKALFSLNRKKAASPAAATRVAQTPPATVAKPSGPQAPAPAVSPQNAASRLQSMALADAQPVATENTKGPLKWRAKGAPSTSSPTVQPSSSDNSRMQMATHTQPVGAHPASAGAPATASRLAQAQGVAPPPAVVTPSRESQPQAPPVAEQKSLIPQSIMTGKTATGAPIPQAPPQPTFELTSKPQATKALVPIITPPAVGPTVAESSPGAGPKRSLFPTMFIKNLPWMVNLVTKPPPAAPVGMPPSVRPVYIVLQAQDFDEMIDSYYAAPVEGRSRAPKKTSRKRTRGDGFSSSLARSESTARSRARSDMARSAHQRAAESRSYEPPDDIPPLAKPFWFISEITKLPKFLTGKSRGRGEVPRLPSFPNSYRAMVARRADPHTVPMDRTIGDEFLDDEMAEPETDGAPDVSVELPSKRRKQTDGENAPDDREPRGHSELAARPKTKLSPREELHQLYLAAVAGHSEPQEDRDTDADRQRAESRSDETRDKPAVAIEQSAEPKPVRTKITRIRKSDGSSVTVYHVGAAAGEGEKQAEAVVFKARTSKPPAPAHRRLTRESDQGGTFRDNPLR